LEVHSVFGKLCRFLLAASMLIIMIVGGMGSA
jgi:hypothetical protein